MYMYPPFWAILSIKKYFKKKKKKKRDKEKEDWDHSVGFLFWYDIAQRDSNSMMGLAQISPSLSYIFLFINKTSYNLVKIEINPT